MITWAFAAVIVLVSILIGIAVHRAPPFNLPLPAGGAGLLGVQQFAGGPIQIAIPRWIVRLAAGIAVGVLVWLASSLLNRHFAATDDPIFTRSDELSLDAGNAGKLTLLFNRTAPLQTSFEVALRVQQPRPGFPVHAYRATLTAPSDVELVTSRGCAAPPKPPTTATTLAACDDLRVAGGTIETLWAPIGKKTGTYELAVSAADFGFPRSSGGQLSAVLNHAGDQVTGVPANGVLRVGDAVIDADHREIRFPLVVLTSLGVTQETYDWVSAIGAVVAALFGTGWLLKLLTGNAGGGGE